MKKHFFKVLSLGLIAIIVAFLSDIETVRLQLAAGATILQTQLTDTIGLFRTNVNTSLVNLNNQLTSTTTTDPGHFHTLGVSIATTTSAFFDTDQAQTFNGQKTFGSSTIFNKGATFVNLPTVPTDNPTSSTQLASKGYVDSVTAFGVLSDTSLTVATSSISSGTIASKGFLRVLFYTSSTSINASTAIKFNSSSEATYATRFSNNGGTDGNSSLATFIDPQNLASTSTIQMTINITNSTSSIKTGDWSLMSAGGTNVPNRSVGAFSWATSTSITNITIYMQTVTSLFATGTRMLIQGI